MTTVLVIDDNREMRQATHAVLEFGGYSVMEAGDGNEGLELARSYIPDIILSDIVMPTMDGYGLIEALQNDPNTAMIPVIFLTALAEDHAMRQGMTLGADDYLIKPTQPQQLLKAIDTRLRKRARIANKHDSSLNTLRNNIVYALPHEMRTPLHLILGYADLLESSDETTSLNEVIEFGAAITQAGRRLERIIENYLVYAQLEVIAADPQEREVLRNNLTGEAHKVIEEAATQQASDRDRLPDLECHLEPAALRISRENLAKIVSELVDNAIKFSESGTPIRIVAGRADDCYMIDIEDKGRGMDAKQAGQIGAYMQFERTFYEQQGLGLGLIIVKRMVELHGGKMIVSNRLDGGTQICVCLPLE